MPRPIAFDLSRLYWGGAGSTPRGIDRVEMSFARRLFDDPARGDVGLVPTLSHMGVVTGREARTITARVERHWRENQPPGGDARYAALRAWLNGQAGHPEAVPRTRSLPRLGHLAWHCGTLLAPARWTGLRPAASSVPRGAAYVNTGQLLLGSPWPLRWLERRPDVRVVMMIHDAIPHRYPEYVGPFLVRRHARAIATAARYATALLATSHASADDLRRELAVLGRGDMPMHVVPLPVSDSILAGGGDPQPSARPYFVAIGALDQRKNYGLLLNLWRDLVRSGRDPLPRLVIAGSRGMRSASLTDRIARSPGLGAAVTVVSGLSSPAVRDLLRGARALLAPSFVEGFGLPVAEARAIGVPVIASDVAAHREVGGPASTYLHPLDGLAWRRAVLERAGEDAAADARRRASLGGTTPQSWASYFADALPFIEAL